MSDVIVSTDSYYSCITKGCRKMRSIQTKQCIAISLKNRIEKIGQRNIKKLDRDTFNNSLRHVREQGRTIDSCCRTYKNVFNTIDDLTEISLSTAYRFWVNTYVD